MRLHASASAPARPQLVEVPTYLRPRQLIGRRTAAPTHLRRADTQPFERRTCDDTRENFPPVCSRFTSILTHSSLVWATRGDNRRQETTREHSETNKQTLAGLETNKCEKRNNDGQHNLHEANYETPNGRVEKAEKPAGAMTKAKLCATLWRHLLASQTSAGRPCDATCCLVSRRREKRKLCSSFLASLVVVVVIVFSFINEVN